MMPRRKHTRKHTREQNRAARIAAERRERTQVIAEEGQQRQAWLAANYRKSRVGTWKVFRPR